MSLCGAPIGENRFPGRSGMKRIVDFGLALMTLPFTLPLMAVVATAIRVTSPGPVLMRLSCVGRHGKVFRQYRFRVIRSDLTAGDLPAAGRGDIRCLTAVGAFLLPLGLNQLPQIFNVLKGEMSLIGPPAVAVANWDSAEEPDPRLLSARPGVVSPESLLPGARELSESERQALTLAYATTAGARTDGRLVLNSMRRPTGERQR